MYVLIWLLGLSSWFLSCISSAEDSPMSGFYTDGLDKVLDKVEIVYPERVSKDGSFVSYYLPQYYNLETMESRPKRMPGDFEGSSDDAIHFFVPIDGEKHHLELWPNTNFLAPGIVIERRDARDIENINKAKISQISQKQCHYNGKIVGRPDSRAALSTCYGLAGYIRVPGGEEYLIEPVKDSKPTHDKEHPHIIYKRSGFRDKSGHSNCLTKGTAQDALDERLKWEAIFGDQVRKDFSGLNMNEVMKDYASKPSLDNSKVNNQLDSTQNYMSLDDKHSNNENSYEENKSKTQENLPSPYEKNENNFDENLQLKQPYNTDLASPLGKTLNKIKIDIGNKLKQKPLREEMGNIKLPDINISPLEQIQSQPTSVDHFINSRPEISKYAKPNLLHESFSETRRTKRDLSGVYNEADNKKDNSIHLNYMDVSDTYKNDFKNDKTIIDDKTGANYEVDSPIKSQENGKISEINSPDLSNLEKNDLEYKIKREIQENGDDPTNLIERETDVNKNFIGGKVDKKQDFSRNVFKRNYDNQVNNLPNNAINNKYANEVENQALSKESDRTITKHNSEDKIQISHSIPGNKGLLTESEAIDKRDIHLDTSEKSWQVEENSGKSNLQSNSINYKGNFNDESISKYSGERLSTLKNSQKSLDREKNKDGKPSKISNTDKVNLIGDAKIMADVLESVVKDADKSKVKKDIIGSVLKENKNPESLPIYSKIANNQNPEKYMMIDQINSKDMADLDDKNEKSKSMYINSKISPEISKESRQDLDVNEHFPIPNSYDEKSSQNNVDEIVIRIKTPEGAVSDVKHNSESEIEILKKDNSFDGVINPVAAKDSTSGYDYIVPVSSSKNKIKTNEIDKNKRNLAEHLENNTKQNLKVNKQSDSQDYKQNSFQNLDNSQNSKQRINEIHEDKSINKVKRDENTIHLVIETEPEVKSAENRNPESPGSNLFCQGRNCLEIKPVFLNDTKSAVATNNTIAENSKDKIVEKRDTDDDDENCGTTTTQKPLMCFDFFNRVFSLELMITVDYKVVRMHDDDDIENFILTVINMVSSNFYDKSIGININVALIRLILLTTCIKELDSDRFNPEELLENFCTWQVLVNPGRDDHPHHHDLAIFITRMDKCEGQIMGVTYMTSVCRPDKACLVCVDEGLLLANTITHQIGHSLGADHDDGADHNGCAGTLPDGTTYYMAPTITETASAWSICSREAIIQFMKTQGSWCLQDLPLVKNFNFPIMLPGQIYSAAQQCRLNFHMTAVPCSIGAFCNKLYCQITDKLCATKGDPPADGTFCAANMWCFHKQCVHIGRRPGAINGEWGPWTDWSLCTRSCGGGVSSSYRICNNPRPENGGRYCIGERIRHKMCATKPCQGFTESFRDLQCKRTEDRPFRGKIHNWVQYQSLFISIECALVCQNRKGDVVMRSPIVADGTPCKAGTRNVCIQGSCRSVGCDWVIDSNAKEDACGICHGNGTECKVIQGVFDEAISKKGLIEFLRIPKESGMIFVREAAPSNNVIVVSGSINRVFYLNGLGSEDSMAGDVAFGQTHGVYEKRGGMERIFIRGPTKEELIFYVLFREANKGIHYQYAVMEIDLTYIPRYQWQYLDWDPCTDPCSGGSQRAHAKCVEDRGGVVDDKYCTENTRPLDVIRPCNDFPCQAKWWVSVWSDCICTGSSSVMFRSVLCMRANDESGTRVEIVKESECALNKKPPTQKPCNATDEENDCAKRSITDKNTFGLHRDLRRSINPSEAFSEFAPADLNDANVHTAELLSEAEGSHDLSEKNVDDVRNLKKNTKLQNNKNMLLKGNVSKIVKPKLIDKEQLDKKKNIRINNDDKIKSNEVSKNKNSQVITVSHSDDLPIAQGKGKQIAKLNVNKLASLNGLLNLDRSKQAEDSDNGSQGPGNTKVDEKCESTTDGSTCPTPEPESTEHITTCKQTCAIQPHKKTTCCKTTPHRKYTQTTMETTTIRPVAVKMDELNINNFALTVVPLQFSGRRKLLPQSDPEFINLGEIGQFGVGDESNGTIITGQEALDLLEFARSNASEEPIILHEGVHN